MEKSKGRNEQIDVAKGIAIALVVLAHAYTDYSASCGITVAINSFHMPFFFIVSGMLAATTYQRKGAYSFSLGRKLRSLFVPYFVWGGVFMRPFYCF